MRITQHNFRADATGHFGEVVGFGQTIVCVLPHLLTHQIIEFGDDVAERAAAHAVASMLAFRTCIFQMTTKIVKCFTEPGFLYCRTSQVHTPLLFLIIKAAWHHFQIR